jgi:hypothetical protein
MTLGFPTLLIKILACIPIDRYKKIGTICVKDTCFKIPFAAARGLRSQCLRSYSAVCDLHDDRQAENKQYNKNKSNRTTTRGISIL